MLSNKVLQNIIYLFLTKVVNYLGPLIVLPIIVSRIGADKLGQIGLATAVATNFGILSDIGFDLYAPHKTAVIDLKKENISKFFWSLIGFRVSMAVLGVVALFIYSLFVTTQNLELVTICFLIVIGQTLNPTWFFVGRYKSKFIFTVYSITKLFSYLLILIFIKREGDFYYYPLVEGIFLTLAGVISLSYVINNEGVAFYFPTIRDIKNVVVDMKFISLSKVILVLFSNLSILFIGRFAGDSQAGYFYAIKRIIDSLAGVLGPVNQVLTTHFTRVGQNFNHQSLKWAKRLVQYSFIPGFVLTLILFNFSDLLTFYIFKSSNESASLILKIMSPIPFLIGLSNILGIQILIGLGFFKSFFKSIFSSCLIGIGLSYYLISKHDANGAAFSLLSVELMITVIMLFYVNRDIFRKVSK